MASMTKEVFRLRWDKDDRGDGITYDDIADCAIDWGLYNCPRICPIDEVKQAVLKAAMIEGEIS